MKSPARPPSPAKPFVYVATAAGSRQPRAASDDQSSPGGSRCRIRRTGSTSHKLGHRGEPDRVPDADIAGRLRTASALALHSGRSAPTITYSGIECVQSGPVPMEAFMNKRIATTAVVLGAVVIIALAAAVPWNGRAPTARTVTVSIEVLSPPEAQQQPLSEIVSTASRLPAR